MKWLQSLSIRRLILFLMLLMALPAAGLILLSGLQNRETDLKDVRRVSAYLVNSVASELENKVDSSRQMMEMLSLLPDVRQRNSDAVNHLLADILGKYPAYANILMLDRAGMTWAGITPDNKPVNMADRKAFRDAIESGNFSTGEYVLGKITQKSVLNFAFPLKDDNGKTDGAILCGINLETINSLLDADSLPAGTSFGIFDHKGIFLYRTVDSEKFIGKQDRESNFNKMKSGPDEGVMDIVSNDGIHRFAAYRKIRLSRDQPPYAYIRGGTPTETALKHSNTALTLNLAIMTLILMLVFGASLLFSKRLLVDRLLTLQNAYDRLASGDLQVRIAEQVTGGELGALGQAFDDMTQKLADNIRERNHAAEEYQAIVRTTSDGFIICDIQGRIVETNAAYCTMLGYTRQELLGKSIADIDEIENPEMVAKRIEKIVETGSDCFQSKHRRKDGSIVDVDVSITYLTLQDGRFYSFVRDITERKQVEIELIQREQALANSERFLKTIIDTEPECIKLLDIEGNLLMMNPAGLAMIQADSLEQVKGQCVFSLITDPYRDAFIDLTRQVFLGISGTLEFETIGLKGRHVWLETHAVPFISETGEITSLLGVTRDITDRKRAEEERLILEQQLFNTQKLESLGILAGGIAHDFNNILTAIIGNADLALMKVSPTSPAVDNLHKIEQGAARAADLAKQMLAYSGKGKFVVEILAINNLLEEMLHMLQVSISKKADLRLNLDQNLPAVEADATQIRQIVMNLLINASEAMGERHGVIAITTGSMECNKKFLSKVKFDKSLKTGRYVFLEINDTGCGMDKETLTKVFDPFFTTKFTGRGLGMAAVQGIVRGHHGFITVYSEPDKGTTFKVFLPASDESIENKVELTRKDGWRGEGKVLLVDDEESVRDVGSEMLRELGFTVITANDGTQAIEIIKASPEISFVVLDLTMPLLGGEECFGELKKHKSDIKVVISSGFSEEEVSQKFAGRGLAGFIQKPYKLSSLKDTIKKI